MNYRTVIPGSHLENPSENQDLRQAFGRLAWRDETA